MPYYKRNYRRYKKNTGNKKKKPRAFGSRALTGRAIRYYAGGTRQAIRNLRKNAIHRIPRASTRAYGGRYYKLADRIKYRKRAAIEVIRNAIRRRKVKKDLKTLKKKIDPLEYKYGTSRARRNPFKEYEKPSGKYSYKNWYTAYLREDKRYTPQMFKNSLKSTKDYMIRKGVRQPGYKGDPNAKYDYSSISKAFYKHFPAEYMKYRKDGLRR